MLKITLISYKYKVYYKRTVTNKKNNLKETLKLKLIIIILWKENNKLPIVNLEN